MRVEKVQPVGGMGDDVGGSPVHEKAGVKGAGELAEGGRLRALRGMLQGSDADLSRITADMLPDELIRLEGVKQNPVHEGLSPLQHTFKMLALLDTSGLKYPELVRAAALFHDIGKAGGAVTTRDFFEHPRRSAEMARPLLERMGYAGWEVDVVSQLIGTHDLLGRAAQRDEDTERSLVSPHQALSELQPSRAAGEHVSIRDVFEMHYRIISADIKSIPGLAQYEPGIRSEYEWYLRSHIRGDVK